jgi:hypothetical protein
VFGIDAEGRRHRWGRHFDRIVVTDGDGTTIHAEGITDETPTELRCETTGRTFEVPATVAEWVQFIDDASAWVGTWLDAETAPEAIRRHEAAEAELEDTA